MTNRFFCYVVPNKAINENRIFEHLKAQFSDSLKQFWYFLIHFWGLAIIITKKP